MALLATKPAKPTFARPFVTSTTPGTAGSCHLNQVLKVLIKSVAEVRAKSPAPPKAACVSKPLVFLLVPALFKA